jgi:hypothetical protein
VRSGDTLQAIAQAAYGDSSLWYLIAEANGLRGNQDLRVGQALNVPTRVSGAQNSASTFKPYDPSKLVGGTTPNLPAPQAEGGGCGTLGIFSVGGPRFRLTVVPAWDWRGLQWRSQSLPTPTGCRRTPLHVCS